ncbi:hypothetical protein SSEA_SKINNY_76 [Mycobacterium phage Skinny]|uniref:Uncharacterized protein n=6 Tax=Bongovirus bongo TaxID=1983750 RepID=A0A0M5M0T2_9CAUD|nr:hypothetical protein PEGLEG_72 [Mycobacterium phage PegLeg]YP_009604931.1 hypothetical protein FDH95_gp073 [Mycobacterium phage Bongo]ALF00600.1 hypothetical protein SEA_BRICOLE_72 [Mycobacterium phage Bricole]AXQ52714.1 hypothetical protein SEA_IPHANE7_73 [Mycobacterium phage IPhane7]QDH93647.1 hypothetical protein SEA_LILHOMIEP_73 [Mycobacterium phage LilhomieP]QGJ93218.1 hypothetical protein SEA_TYDAWG_73 [Mycobacterium phage TyDawg]QUU29274.1 hypothetical protein [Mycobacterium phage S
MSEQCWGGTLSSDGRIQVLENELAEARARANNAERKLAAVIDLVDRWMRDYGPGTRTEEILGPQKVSVAFVHRSIKETANDA